MNYLSVLFVFGLCLWSCESYKILAVFPMPAHSHYAISSNLLRELAKRGHEVTVYTPYLEKTPVKNLKEVPLTSLVDIIEEEKKSLLRLGTETFTGLSSFLFKMGVILTENTLKHENIQKLLQTDKKYDLVLLPQFLNDGLLGIAYHFKAPYVLLATMPLLPWGSFLLDHPSPPSYVPNLLAPYDTQMNFWQRLINSYYDLYVILYHQWIDLPVHRELVRKYIPEQPDLYNFLNNASLVLINSHMSSYAAMPLVPNAIEVGGLHIQEPKKLPEDLQRFLDDSVDGVIVFSLGSNLKSSSLPPKKRDDILKAFSKVKQNVLWKWETDTLPGQPKNVKLMKWLPQSDVLVHPNVKAAIIHGGLLSSMECIYHGVPFIGIPFFGDQRMNMATAESYGYGIKIFFEELNEERLSSALDEVLNNPKYKINIQKRSQIMRDRPMKPLDSAVYWIEYVIRHQGASHLRYPGMNLTWCQRNLVDVIAFTLLTLCLTVFVFVFIIKKVLKTVFKSTEKKKQQ